MKEYYLRQEVRIQDNCEDVEEQLCIKLSYLKENADEAKMIQRLGETACDSLYSLMVKEHEPEPDDFEKTELRAVQNLFNELE